MSSPSSTPGVSSRLLRGYGPLVGLVVLLLLMSILVPSKPQQRVEAAAASDVGPGAASDSTTGATGDTVAGGTSGGATTGDTTAGAAGGATGGTAQKGAPPAGEGIQPCPDRKEQVPGDPYSPPCIAFSGDNGGATSKGVTPTEIHVSYRVLNEKGFQQTLAELAGASLQDRPEDIKRTVSALAEYFNKRFQFYGRKIVIDFYNGVGSNTDELLGKGRDKAEADAETVSSQLKSFADMSATSEPYADALFRRKVMGFGDPYLSTNWHNQHAPYIWSLAVEGTKVAKLAAEYTIKRLSGPGGKALPAKWAGGSIKDKPRVIASMAPENSWYQESVQAARADTKAAGVPEGPNIEYQLDLGTMSNQAANIIPKLKSQGVTTILCGCDPIMPVFLTGEMARQNYFPELIVVGTALTDTDIVGQLWNQEAAKHAFGVSSLQAFEPPTKTIAYAAYKSVRPDEPAFTVDLIYYQMQMLAIGIQMAGPNLTPESFEAGMFRYPPKVGPLGYWVFGPSDYTAANDVREVFWDPSATSTYNGKKGAYIDPQPGTRWKVNELPAGDPNIPVR
jgi:hypothetical protein